MGPNSGAYLDSLPNKYCPLIDDGNPATSNTPPCRPTKDLCLPFVFPGTFYGGGCYIENIEWFYPLLAALVAALALVLHKTVSTYPEIAGE